MIQALLLVVAAVFISWQNGFMGPSFQTPEPELTTSAKSQQDLQNATLYTLCRNNDLYDLLETIQNYEDRFNGRFHYDWVFLNDKPFDDRFKLEVSNLVSGKARFGQIDAQHWQFPSSLNRTLMEENIQKLLSDEDGVLPYADSVSYRHMCRFESGFFYRHPLLQEYKYFWRVEPGVKLYCDIDYDIFAHMNAYKYAYAFALSILEYPKSIPSLFRHVKDYLLLAGKEALLHDESNYSRFVYDGTTDSYNLCHFWTNLELGDLDVFRSQEYNEMFEYLDRQNGFFYERWGDAPVRSLILSLILKKGQIHRLADIGYKHEPYLQCPTGAALRRAKKCSCNPDMDFTHNWYSCSWWFDRLDGS
ncbi:hypothetical protein KL905_005266 [Ogataea polymorpha]|nr:hypothetical protein KL905_005266 [Ogataea polymorpha]